MVDMPQVDLEILAGQPWTVRDHWLLSRSVNFHVCPDISDESRTNHNSAISQLSAFLTTSKTLLG